MLEMDPPKHARYRLLVNKGFTPRMIGLLEQALDSSHAESIVDEVIEKGAVRLRRGHRRGAAAAGHRRDHGCAAGGPAKHVRVVEQDDRRSDPEYASDDTGASVMELFAYSDTCSRRSDVTNRATTSSPRCSTRRSRASKLSELEFDMFMMLLVVAGNETTRNATAHGMHALHGASRPAALVQSDPDQYFAPPRRGPPVGHAGAAFPAHRHEGHRDPRPPDQGRRQASSSGTSPPTVTKTCTTTRSTSTSPATRTRTSRSVAAARTSASAPTWPRMELRLILREVLSRVCPTSRRPASRNGCRSNFIGGIKHLPVTWTPGTRVLTGWSRAA